MQNLRPHFRHCRPRIYIIASLGETSVQQQGDFKHILWQFARSGAGVGGRWLQPLHLLKLVKNKPV